MYKQAVSFKLLLLVSLLLSVLGLAALPKTAAADESLLFGQKQSYTAIVRSDQKVVTYAKIVLNNQDDTDLKEASFSAPKGVTISNLSAYQIIPPVPSCVEYDEQANVPAKDWKCLRYDTNEYDFDQDYYYYGYSYYPYEQDRKLTYKKIDLKQSGDKYTFALPEAIKPEKRGAYLVAYQANGFVKGSFGLYNLEFKTLQVDQPIEEVRVAVDVASDLYTKEKRSKINYANTSADTALSGAQSGKAIESKSLDQLQSQIGSGGTFTKTGKSLAPGEVFVVNGEFADEPWKLNLGWIIGGIIGTIILIGVVVLLLKKANQAEEVVVTGKGGKNGKK